MQAGRRVGTNIDSQGYVARYTLTGTPTRRLATVVHLTPTTLAPITVFRTMQVTADGSIWLAGYTNRKGSTTPISLAYLSGVSPRTGLQTPILAPTEPAWSFTPSSRSAPTRPRYRLRSI